jgi:hypothetical protein
MLLVHVFSIEDSRCRVVYVQREPCGEQNVVVMFREEFGNIVRDDLSSEYTMWKEAEGCICGL